MKKLLILLQLLILSSLLFSHSVKAAEDKQPITHVIMVWLKQPVTEKIRNDFIKASETLNDLPNIIHRHVGVVSASDRKIVDDSFDVAITVTLKNKAALADYLNHSKHKKVLATIKPWVKRVVAYDFVSQ